MVVVVVVVGAAAGAVAGAVAVVVADVVVVVVEAGVVAAVVSAEAKLTDANNAPAEATAMINLRTPYSSVNRKALTKRHLVRRYSLAQGKVMAILWRWEHCSRLFERDAAFRGKGHEPSTKGMIGPPAKTVHEL